MTGSYCTENQQTFHYVFPPIVFSFILKYFVLKYFPYIHQLYHIIEADPKIVIFIKSFGESQVTGFSEASLYLYLYWKGVPF